MELHVEKLIYGGDGLAHLPSDDPERAGKAVFVPFTLPGETVEAKIVEQKPGFGRARVTAVKRASPDRTAASCPYFGNCGGCQYQHMTYDAQLRAKAEILRETLQRTAKFTPPEIVAHASTPWNYRNRTRMRVQAQPGFAIGYNRFASHTLLPVRECPISSPLINRALAALWKLGEAGRVPPQVVEIEYFVNADDSEILLEVTLARENVGRAARELIAFITELRAEVPEVTGVVPFAQAGGPDRVRRLNVPREIGVALGRDSLLYRTREAQYQVSAGSFFQTNRFLVETMVALACGTHAGERALDLYAGAGLFTLPLSQNFREVDAVEVAPFSFHDLHANAPASVKAHRTRSEEFLLRAAREHIRYDYIVVDPPRGGLGEAASAALAQLEAPQLTYVSCDPATLARDLKVLLAAGYQVSGLHLLDLFPQTFHIETIVHLEL